MPIFNEFLLLPSFCQQCSDFRNRKIRKIWKWHFQKLYYCQTSKISVTSNIFENSFLFRKSQRTSNLYRNCSHSISVLFYSAARIQGKNIYSPFTGSNSTATLQKSLQESVCCRLNRFFFFSLLLKSLPTCVYVCRYCALFFSTIECGRQRKNN
jgi:hypothetical protein